MAKVTFDYSRTAQQGLPAIRGAGDWQYPHLR